MYNFNNKKVNLLEMIICLINAVDLIRPGFAKHQHQVAYWSFIIAEQLNLPKSQWMDLILAGLLHDIDGFLLNVTGEFIDVENTYIQENVTITSHILKGIPSLSNAAEILKYIHVSWNNGEGEFALDNQVLPLSHIIHLADKITDLVKPDHNIIGQIKYIQSNIAEQKNTVFAPEFVDTFINLSVNEYIWLDMMDKPFLSIKTKADKLDEIYLDLEETIKISKVFANIVDFRSPFTAIHSAGVAKTAEKLAELAGLSENECKMMLIAGYLHDLGKLTVSNELLGKPSELNTKELDEIKSHPFYTYNLLKMIKGLENISIWASLHHEKLNGKGYPFKLTAKSIPLGSRIMAVADIFTALLEDRSYRKGMTKEHVIAVLNAMVNDQSISPYVVSILMNNFDLINEVRKLEQRNALNEYNYLIKIQTENSNKPLLIIV